MTQMSEMAEMTAIFANLFFALSGKTLNSILHPA